MRREDEVIACDERSSGELLVSGERPWRERREMVAARKRLFDRKRLGKSLAAAASLGDFLLSVFVLARVVADLDLGAVRAAIANTTAEQIAGAFLLTAISIRAHRLRCAGPEADPREGPGPASPPSPRSRATRFPSRSAFR